MVHHALVEGEAFGRRADEVDDVRLLRVEVGIERAPRGGGLVDGRGQSRTAAAFDYPVKGMVSRASPAGGLARVFCLARLGASAELLARRWFHSCDCSYLSCHPALGISAMRNPREVSDPSRAEE
jgi:hypothetical protein